MKIIFFGSAEFGIPSLEALKESGNKLLGIFTQPPRPAGRHRHLAHTAVDQWAQQNNIPCTPAADVNNPEMARKIVAHQADLLIVIAFGQKISPQIIRLFPKGAINVHASLLPAYRGAAPINYAIMNNDSCTGISIITLADKMDAGKVLLQKPVPISPDDDAQTIHDKLANTSPLVLLEAIGQIASDTAVYKDQDESLVTYAHKLKKADGFIDWTQPAEKIKNKIRGLWPWPGATADFVAAKTGKCSRVTIARANVIPNDSNPGTFGLLDEDMNVICGKDRLQIERLKPAGSHLMDFRDFVNGRAVAPRDLFLPIEQAKKNG